MTICPHCSSEYQVGLELTPEEFKQLRAELRERLEADADDKKTRKELIQLLYFEAMRLRYEDNIESLALFEEVLELQPNHWEARMKVSWLCIRFMKNERAIEVLLPLVESSEPTILQKQRAYTNLSCAEDWKKVDPDHVKAENWARIGIELDHEGTSKLWENLATALKSQQKYEEARAAFKHAIKLNPKSVNAIERQASIDRHLKIQKRQERGKKFHLKNPRDLLPGKKSPKGGDFIKI